MAIMRDGEPPLEESPEELAAFVANSGFIHYVGMLIPPRRGFLEWMQALEHMHFKPRTPRNDLFHLRVIEWEDIAWGIVSIPIDDKDKAEELLRVYALRAADGVPTLISSGAARQFPVSNPRVFTIENSYGRPPQLH